MQTESQPKTPGIKQHELLALHSEIVNESRVLMAAKNNDYANDPQDAFGNLRLCEDMGLVSLPAGVLVRLSDKIKRLSVLLTKDPSVVDEKSIDTIYDSINYLVILAAALGHRPAPVAMP